MKQPQAKMKLMESMLLLLESEEFDALSVSKICKTAHVHRSTFYSYFDNQYDLLEASSDYMITKFQTAFSKADKEAQKKAETSLDDSYLMPYLNFIRDNKAFYLVYLKNHTELFSQENTFEHLLGKIFIPRYQAKGITDKRVIRYMSRFYVHGISAIIKEWVLQDCSDSVEDICLIIQQCVLH